LHLNCSKIVFGWGFAPDPIGEAHSATPDPLADLGEGKGGERRERREREGWREGDRNGEGTGNLPAHFLEASTAYDFSVTKCQQSVPNAAAHLMYNRRRYDHVSDALVTLHSLQIPERIQFKLAVQVHRVLHGTAPSHLGPLLQPTDVSGRQSLIPASSHHLIVPSVRLATVGARAFPVAGPIVWNSLPANITSADNLPSFVV
jgi:hypothetical protein